MSDSKKQHGGKRAGAGRHASLWGASKPMRIPLDAHQPVKQFLQAWFITQDQDIHLPTDQPSVLPLPLFASHIAAGFPSPADDYVEGMLDLNQHLVAHPAATFFLRVTGESMIGAGIYPGDLLIVDRSITPSHGLIVVAAVDGDLTVKRLEQRHQQVRLLPENPAFLPIVPSDDSQWQIWGVVTHSVRDHRLRS